MGEEGLYRGGSVKTITILATGLLLFPGSVRGQDSPSDFVGSWELVTIEVRAEAGEWAIWSLPRFGTPVGLLMYDDFGNMSVQITGTPRSTENPPENPGIVHGYVAYYGRYEVDAEQGTVTHHRQNHLNPEMGSLSAVRYFEFSVDQLTLTVAPEGGMRLIWRRLK
jgi:hypothetical protein